MTREQIEAEKKELERQIQVNEDQIKTAQTAIYWLKKRIKVAEAQLKEMGEEQKVFIVPDPGHFEGYAPK